MPLNAPEGRTDIRRLIAAVRTAHEHVVYFAHSLRDYGTQAEARALSVIRRRWPKSGVLNPADWGTADIHGEFGSYAAFYEAAVGGCDLVCVLEHDGHVGRGVYEEVQIAQRTSRKVHAIRHGRVLLVQGVELVDHRDWKCRYGRLVTNRMDRAPHVTTR